MDLQMTLFTEGFAKECSKWKYDGDYAIYNLPDWDFMVKENWAMTKNDLREKQYLAFINENGEFAAFTRISETESGIMIGIGVNPDFLSKGVGRQAVILTTGEISKRCVGERIYLEVRNWNARAIKCYENAGYVKVKEFEQITHIGKGIFIQMEYRS